MEEHGEINHLIIRVARAHLAIATQLLRRHEIYPGQELLLMRLWQNDHQSQTELARSLKVDASTVTRTLQSLERRGLLTRAPSPADRRTVIVSLTAAGVAMRQNIDEVWSELEAITVAGLSDNQRSQAERLLRRIERNLIGHDLVTGEKAPAADHRETG